MKQTYYIKPALSACISFFKKETVLSTAGLLAILSAFFVKPSPEYFIYLDYRVLSLLFCLMAVVAGLQNIGLFRYLGTSLLSGTKTTRQLVFQLMALCFFSSMFITNDVSLITFVPFAIMLLSMANETDLLIPVVVLQTIAANLGSMFTPVGNPQNLYLYSGFSIPIGKFLIIMLPLTVLSFFLLTLSVFLLPNKPLEIRNLERIQPPKKRPLFIYLFLFGICLGCVAHLIPYQVMLAIIILGIWIYDRSLFRKADYYLLLTFVCFFIFIGNMERIPAISSLLRSLIAGKELLFGLLLSQVISNVPAAILLSGFTDQVIPLLYGVNVGGLGTLIASLASLISYRCYSNTEGAEKGHYFKVFTIYNLIFFIALTIASICLL